MRRRTTQSGIGQLADKLLRRADPTGKRFGAQAVEAWRHVAGPEASRHTHGASLREGELLVYVDQPAWANELALMADEYRRSINEELGEDLVRSVRFTVSKQVSRQREAERVEAEHAEYYLRDHVPPVPLTEQERAQVAYTVASIEDEGMRNAAERAMTAYLEWKKGTKTRKTP